jgi:drug/metabolite transporter (DMT)-like permease
MNRTLTGSLFILTAAASFAFLPTLTKLGYRAGMMPLDLVTWRFLFAALAVWLVWPLWHKHLQGEPLSGRQIATLLATGALYSFVALTAFWALDRVPATTYVLLFYTYPAVVALISVILGERLSIMAWGAIGLALAGCALTTGGALEIAGFLDVLFPFLNAVSYAIYLVIVGRTTRQTSGLVTGTINITGTALVLFPLSLMGGGLHPPATISGWMAVLGLAVVGTALPILAISLGIARIGASNAAILAATEPLLAVALATALLGEHVTTTQYIGGAIILASVFLLQVSMRKTSRPSQTHEAEASTK